MPKKTTDIVKIVTDAKIKRALRPLTDSESGLLEESILAEGVRDPLVVWQREKENVLLDGYHRYAICTKHGIPFKTVSRDVGNMVGAIIWITKNQKGRRNLSEDELALLAIEEIAPGIEKKADDAHKKGTSHGGGDRRSKDWDRSFFPEKKTDTVPSVHVIKELHDCTGLSTARLSNAKAVVDEIKEHPDQEEKLRQQVDEHGLRKVAKDVRKKRKKEKRTAEAKVAMKNMPSVDKRFSLHVCSVADLHEHVKAHSVDCIITDPPYPMEYLECWSELAGFAAHALKPTGSLVAMSGQSYLADIIHRLGVELDYWWTLCYLTPGKKTQAIQRKVNAAWKPLLWYVPRGEKPKVVQLGSDVFVSEAPDKEHHDWGQSESGMLDIVNRMTTPGQTICDPFVGGGATAVAAVSLGRYFVGADSEEIEIGKTKKRLADVKEVK